MKLSIIIPVYNVEEYVAKCIHSCLHQNLPQKDYEIIIINDGSTDSSLKIVEQFEAANIHVYTQENAGLSAARNNGLLKAQGEYVWFVDSDDWIEENCLISLLLEVSGHDVLAFGCVNHENGIATNMAYSFSNLTSGKQFMLNTNCRFMMGAPFYLYRKQFLIDNGLAFFPGIFHEDAEFTPRVLYLSDNIKVSNQSYYQRRIRLDSITRTENPKKAYDLLVVCSHLDSFVDIYVHEPCMKRLFNELEAMFLNMSMNILMSVDASSSSQWNTYFYRNKLFYKYLNSGKIKYMLEGIGLAVFGESPLDFYRLLKTLKL